MELDQVHRGHRQARAVDQASNVPFEADVTEPRLPRAQLGGVFLGHVQQRGDLGVAEESVVVEVQLAIERQHVALVGHDQRVDLGERGVGVDKQLDELAEEDLALLGGSAAQAERLTHLAGLERGEADADVDRLAVDFFGRVVGDDLDIDPTLGRRHQDRALQAAIDGEAKI